MKYYLSDDSVLFPIDKHHLNRLQGVGIALEAKPVTHERGIWVDAMVARVEPHASHCFAHGSPLSAIDIGGMTCAAANALWDVYGKQRLYCSTFYRPGRILREGEGINAYTVRELEYLEIDIRKDTLQWKSAGNEEEGVNNAV